MKTLSSFCWVLALATALAVAASWAFCVVPGRWGGTSAAVFIDEYQKFARTPIFTGFFTMGSFLLALKTTILARVKETYDTQAYRDAFRAKRAKDKNAKYYSGLEALGGALGYNVVYCLVAALLQMTLGFWSNPVAFAICVGFALACLGLLIRLTIEILGAHKDWFHKIETDATNLIDKLDLQNEQKAKEADESSRR